MLLRASAVLLIGLTANACIARTFVYHPTKEHVASPADAGMAWEPVTLRAADGVKLDAWWVPAPGKSRGAVLFCHGNGGNISHRLKILHVMRELRLDTLLFDYRGYGRSEGRITERGLYLDAAAAWDYLTKTRKIPPERIVIWGRSLGGSVAAHLAMSRRPAALVLESTFTSVTDMADESFPRVVVWLCLRVSHATVKYVKKAECPVLVMHSPDDRTVPYAQGRKVFAVAPEPKEFLKITGNHSVDWFKSGGRCARKVEAFISKYLPARKVKK